MIEGKNQSIYHAGDTGYCPHFKEIGLQFAPIDLAILPIGAYSPRWLMRSMHVSPSEAVQMHQDIGSQRSIPCHWGTFNLTDEPLEAPVNQLLLALKKQNIPLAEFSPIPLAGTVSLAATEPSLGRST